MKVFYTTDGSIDEVLEQVCPFGEVHHLTRNDGSEFTTPKMVGCVGCVECPYCYGQGIVHPYGSNPKNWVLMPINTIKENEYNWKSVEQKRIELGKKQFRVLDSNNYIMCSQFYNEIFRNTSKKLKFKIWWWHHVGIKFNEIICKILKFKIDTKIKIHDCFNKWFKRI